MPGYAYFRKQIVPFSQANVSIMTHALHYGTGVFEGIRGNWNKEEGQTYLFRVREHYLRLLTNCRLLRLNPPYTAEELTDITIELVKKEKIREDLYVRPIIYTSSEALWVRLHKVEIDVNIFIIPWGPYLDPEQGARVCISAWRRPDDTMMPPGAKITGFYVNSALARTDAYEKGFDESILETRDGYVSEGSGENIFIISRGQLITPPVYDSILRGITRESVIELARNELEIETVERHFRRSELYLADEFFLTGTAAHITPVVEVDKYKIADGNIGKVTKKLQQLYFEAIYGRNPKYQRWCTPCYPRKPSAGKGRQTK
ncbi:MAG TPA: branched-chain amino acid transaminase [Dehalococcoidia bacterium]|nr:branched-chain amino acid transaminase [Dehalococcoidia bacterium]